MFQRLTNLLPGAAREAKRLDADALVEVARMIDAHWERLLATVSRHFRRYILLPGACVLAAMLLLAGNEAMEHADGLTTPLMCVVTALTLAVTGLFASFKDDDPAMP